MDKQFLYFDIDDKPSYIIIEFCPIDQNSDADLFISPILLSELNNFDKI